LFDNAPRTIEREQLTQLYQDALVYW
jgi:hypothetical protein